MFYGSSFYGIDSQMKEKNNDLSLFVKCGWPLLSEIVSPHETKELSLKTLKIRRTKK